MINTFYEQTKNDKHEENNIFIFKVNSDSRSDATLHA